jgi:hypothetical protein
MSLSRLGDYLDQMLTAANDARRFVDGMSKEDFLADKRTQQAVVMSPSLSARPPDSSVSVTEMLPNNSSRLDSPAP